MEVDVVSQSLGDRQRAGDLLLALRQETERRLTKNSHYWGFNSQAFPSHVNLSD